MTLTLDNLKNVINETGIPKSIENDTLDEFLCCVVTKLWLFSCYILKWPPSWIQAEKETLPWEDLSGEFFGGRNTINEHISSQKSLLTFFSNLPYTPPLYCLDYIELWGFWMYFSTYVCILEALIGGVQCYVLFTFLGPLLCAMWKF